jgi:hypothetical protein
MMGLEEPVALIAHDAGAANHILAWLTATPDADVRAYMAGPAAGLWERDFPERPLVRSIEIAVSEAKSVLTGSGWASDIEHDGRKTARSARMTSVAVIDHWTNYPERFERQGEVILPDQIWVTDKWATRIAQQAFPRLPVVEQDNLYLAAEVARIAALPQGSGVLYVGEPARDNWGRSEPGEFQAFRAFMETRDKLGIASGLPVRVRPHPSEDCTKYDVLLGDWPEAMRCDAPNLASAIADSGWVAGMQSFALTIALAAGRSVVSTLPPWAPPCALPQEGIIHLRDRLLS